MTKVVVVGGDGWLHQVEPIMVAAALVTCWWTAVILSSSWWGGGGGGVSGRSGDL